MLIAVAAIDFDHRIVPNKIVYPLAVYGLVATALVGPRRSARAPDRRRRRASRSCSSLSLAYPRGMGMGDVKLAGVMGLYLGLSIVPALLFAFLTGTIVGVAIIAREGAGAQEGGALRRRSWRSAASSGCSPAPS